MLAKNVEFYCTIQLTPNKVYLLLEILKLRITVIVENRLFSIFREKVQP